MKKLIYLLMLVPFLGNAQIVNIPDPVFKQQLILSGVDTNSDGEIQNTEALATTELLIGGSGISDLTGILSFTNLEYLDCHQNQLTQLNVSGLTNLNALSCHSNQITNLNIANCSGLTSFYCENNLLTSLNFIGVTGPLTFYCDNNSISNLFFPNTITFGSFSAVDNQITDLDLSNVNFTNSGALDLSSNSVQTVNFKNGFVNNLDLLFFFSALNPALQYICADENEITSFNNFFASQGYNSVVVNSYCSFVPSGNFNTITGSIQFDQNANGCDLNDALQPNIKINISNGPNQGTTFTNNSGNYTFYTQTGNFTITPNVENPTFFTFSPTSATIPFADNNNNTATQNFCITANGVHPDIEVVIMPIRPARPGFDATYQIVYKNKGNQTLAGNVILTFDDDKTDFVLAVPNPDNLALNALSWNYTNLLPFESRTINVTLNVNSPQETPAVNIGDQLDFVVAINPVVNDEIPLDNSFSYKQIVVGSFDPNNIECLEGEVVAPSYIGQYLHYAVNFENTGNYPAENIVVKIVIDTTKYDINSLQLLNVSHNSYTRITGNVIEVIFQQINLDSGGHGNLLFKIKTNSNLLEGDEVAKRADIFFDYNAPIDTGMANTTFQLLNNSVFELDNTISIYPNPTNGKVNINVNDNINSTIKSIELYDVQGRLLQMQLLDEVQTSIDISEKSNGIYFLKITSDKGSKVEKIVKK